MPLNINHDSTTKSNSVKHFHFRYLHKTKNSGNAQCLKITEKVSFNIASETSYVKILSGRKLIRSAENGPF